MQINSGKTLFSLVAWIVIFTISLQTPRVESANILGIFTSHSQSHLIIHMSVVKTLAEKGHNVTVLTTIKPKVTHEKIHQIVIPHSEEDEAIMDSLLLEISSKENTVIGTMMKMTSMMSALSDMQYKMVIDHRFKAFYENKDNKFDLVILGYFMNDFELAMAARLECPVVVSWMMSTMAITNDYVGNPTGIAYVPNMAIGLKAGERMTFVQRIQNILIEGIFRAIGIINDYRMEKYYNILTAGFNLRSYSDMKKNVSLVFCNSDSISEGPIRPNVPAIIEIGGIQIKDTPDRLPEDISKFLNASKKHGAILLSLGSNVQSSHIDPKIIKIMFKVLSSIKQNVIWKWDDLKNIPGQSDNIMYKKWLAQDDVLAHPNLKLFITHAGKGGVTESQFHGVPMVALPIFGDQPGNAEKIAASGYGLQLGLLKLTEETFKAAVVEVLTNATYTDNVKQFAQLYRDRPMTAKENVVFWTEYVIRHRGAPHMQSPLVHMNLLQSYNVDLIVCGLLILYIACKLLKYIVKFSCGVFRKNSHKPKYTKVKKH